MYTSKESISVFWTNFVLVCTSPPTKAAANTRHLNNPEKYCPPECTRGNFLCPSISLISAQRGPERNGVQSPLIHKNTHHHHHRRHNQSSSWTSGNPLHFFPQTWKIWPHLGHLPATCRARQRDGNQHNHQSVIHYTWQTPAEQWLLL